MERKLTAEQQLAVDCRESELIVSAAAGAGKTAVLVRRVLGLLTDPQTPCGVDQLLVVTFTNAAAGEMRSRIGDALNERLALRPGDPVLKRQLALLGNSRIQTVHAYCQSLIRENFTLCGVEPEFRLADETECGLYKEEALSETLEEAYRQPPEGFSALSDSLTDGRGDRRLQQTVLEIYERLRSHPAPEKLLSLLPELCCGEPEHTGWGRYLMEEGTKRVRYAADALQKSREQLRDVPEAETAYGGTFDRCLAFAQELLAAIARGWDAACACAGTFKKERLSACRYEDKVFLEEMKASRDLFAARMQSVAEECFSIDSRRAGWEGEQARPMVRALCQLTMDFSRRYQEKKRRRGALDFSDLEHYALGLLQDETGAPTPLALAQRGLFREILVDEYQDTNEIQERIFRMLRPDSGSAFFVGDVKQSIYRFRLANPDIFLDRFFTSTDYTGETGGRRRLALNRNFRSRPEVLEMCNALFSRVMSRTFGDVDYDQRQALYCGRQTEGCVPSELLLLDYDADAVEEESDSRRVTQEARLVAIRVARLLREEMVGEGEERRPLRPEDVAILLSSFAGKAPEFERALTEQGVPCMSAGGGGFFGTLEISVLLSLLRVIDNRQQDIPLISVLRSPLYLFSAEELARVRLAKQNGTFYEALQAYAADNDRGAAVLEDLDFYADQAPELPVSHLLRMIVDRTGAGGMFAALDGGGRRAANVEKLISVARGFDGGGQWGIAAFLRWIDRKLADGEDLTEESGEGGGVRLMSIHRSKGLEFPVVILPDLAKPFNADDQKKPVLFHPDLGIGLRLRDDVLHAEYRTQLQQAIGVRIRQENRSEELRKLYVAMTRAREKLILVLSAPKLPQRIVRIANETAGAPQPVWLAQQDNAMNWIVAALLTHPGCGALRAYLSQPPQIAGDARRENLLCRVYESAALAQADPQASAYAAAADLLHTEGSGDEETPLSGDVLALLEQSGRVYAHLAASRLPSKLTPTGLRRLIPETGEIIGTPQRTEVRTFPAVPLQKPDPRAALRGTAMHTLLQHADLSRCLEESDVQAQAQALAEKGFLSQEQLSLVMPGPIAAFARSPLAQRMRHARRVLREYQFSVLLDAGQLLHSELQGERVLMNGAIDLLLFEEQGLIIIDFKTDRVRPGQEEEKAREHSLQLALYDKAAREIFGVPVFQRWVWFLRTGQGAQV